MLSAAQFEKSSDTRIWLPQLLPPPSGGLGSHPVPQRQVAQASDDEEVKAVLHCLYSLDAVATKP